MDDQEYITTAEAAEILGVGMQRVRDLIRAERLRAKKIGSKKGGIWLVNRDDVENLERLKPWGNTKTAE